MHLFVAAVAIVSVFYSYLIAENLSVESDKTFAK